MINGVHALIYTKDAEAVRRFFRDVLELPSVDAGRGWLIFGLPPAELAAHPTDDGQSMHQLYLMCDDVNKTVAELSAKGVQFPRPVADRGWGLVTSLRLPGGDEIGLYEPRHPTALGLGKKRSARKPGKKKAKKAPARTKKRSTGRRGVRRRR